MPVIDGLPLLSAGVYAGAPEEDLTPWLGVDAVVFGSPETVVATALRLSGACRRVDAVTPGAASAVPVTLRRILRERRDVRLTTLTEIACVAGIERLEIVLLRNTHTGRISAIEAAALFLLSGA
ncbi:MAG TPA: hypothetical protein VFT12_11130 [Thermoanaerobaculia bacterium]|nr:hypothetical protein [Thermoanaerobaculia bacterium]